MQTWEWQVWQGIPFLTCSLLQPWPHGFFTRQGAPRPPHDLAGALKVETAYRVKQVHGNAVLPTADLVPNTAENLTEADGLVTTGAKQSVWVCSADCTPVLIADRATGQVSAIHAGWRGTAAKIVPRGIAQMQAQGSQLADLKVALGPAIAGPVYQVATEVAAQVGATVSALPPDQPAAIVAELMALSSPPILPDVEPGRVRLDVRRVIALQLDQLGLAPEQVAIAPHCTFQDPEHFFSYRRDRQKQVQWSGIVSLEPGSQSSS